MGGNPGGLEGPPSARFPGHLRAPPVSGEHLLCLGPSNVLAGSAGHRTPCSPDPATPSGGRKVGTHTPASAGVSRGHSAGRSGPGGSDGKPRGTTTRWGVDDVPQERPRGWGRTPRRPTPCRHCCRAARNAAVPPFHGGGGIAQGPRSGVPSRAWLRVETGDPAPPPGRAVRLPFHEVTLRVHSRPRPPGLRVGCAGGGPRAPTRPCG